MPAWLSAFIGAAIAVVVAVFVAPLVPPPGGQIVLVVAWIAAAVLAIVGLYRLVSARL